MSRIEKERERELARAVAARAKSILQTGLPARPNRVDILALSQKLVEIVKSPTAVAQRVHDAFERSARHGAPVDRIACKKGCAYCCHGMVAITAPEAFAIAARVKAGGVSAIAEFRDRATAVAGKSATERLGAKLPCPLLGTDGACSIYDVRPLACRRVISFELAPCLEEFDGIDGEIEVPTHYNLHAANILAALSHALTESGRRLDHYEFAVAVLAVLDAPDAEDRWRRGNDPFTHLEPQNIGDDVAPSGR